MKKNLYPLLCKIATSNKLKSQEDRKTAIDKVVEIFGFENQQELINLYHSNYTEEANDDTTPKKFESMVLVDLILSLGLPNKYFMEEHIVKQEKIFVVPKYNFNTFFDTSFNNKN